MVIIKKKKNPFWLMILVFACIIIYILYCIHISGFEIKNVIFHICQKYFNNLIMQFRDFSKYHELIINNSMQENSDHLHSHLNSRKESINLSSDRSNSLLRSNLREAKI